MQISQWLLFNLLAEIILSKESINLNNYKSLRMSIVQRFDNLANRMSVTIQIGQSDVVFQMCDCMVHNIPDSTNKVKRGTKNAWMYSFLMKSYVKIYFSQLMT